MLASEPDQALDLLVPHKKSASVHKKFAAKSVGGKQVASKNSCGPHCHWIKTERADCFFACVVVANAAVLGVDTEISLQTGGDSGPVLFVLELIFYGIFLLEIVVRIIADGCTFFRLSNYDGLFDLLLVVSNTVEYVVMLSFGADVPDTMSVMRVLRLMRIARIGRVLFLCRELFLLVTSLAASFRGIFWVLSMLVVLMYICCLICTMELASRSDELQEYFGSVQRSFFTHMMMLTLEGFPDIAEAVGQVSWIWYFYIIGFIVVSSILAINLVTGLIVEHVCTKSKTLDQNDLPICAAFDLQHFRDLFVELYRANGFDMEQEIDLEEFNRIFRSEAIRDCLNALGISLRVEGRELFKILDSTDRGKLTFEELLAGLLRLQGSKHFIQSVFAQRDIVSRSLEMKGKFANSQDRVSEYCNKVCSSLEEKLSQQVSDIRLAADALPTPEVSPLCGQPETAVLAELLDRLQDRSDAAGNVLARLKLELEASRGRVRHLEDKVFKRVTSVQTETPVVSVADEWNHDREMVAKRVPILAEGKFFIPITTKIDKIDFSKGIERLLNEREEESKTCDISPPIDIGADPKVTVMIVGAKGLQGKAGRFNFCCTCAVPDKPVSQFLTKVANEPEPRWDETHELTNYTPGDALEFAVLDMNRMPKSSTQPQQDASIAAGKLSSEQFFPQGFDGELELSEINTGTVSNVKPHLRVKVHVEGSAVEQALQDSPAYTCKEDESSLHGSSLLAPTPRLTPLHINRADEDLLRFRRHPCDTGKRFALAAMQTPSSSDGEAPLGARRKALSHKRVRGHSADIAERKNVQPISQASQVLARSTPQPLTRAGVARGEHPEGESPAAVPPVEKATKQTAGSAGKLRELDSKLQALDARFRELR